MLERDSKFIHEYSLQTKSSTRREVDHYQTNFPHNFQAVQMPQGRLFLIGGGEFNILPISMFECSEIIIGVGS